MADLGTWPGEFRARAFKLEMSTNQRVNASPFGGNEQAYDLLNDRWMCELTLPARKAARSGELEAFLDDFRGQTNWINLWHLQRPRPRGTISGTPTIAADAAQGASSIQIQAAAGETVLSADMLGVGGLLLRAARGTYTANGSGVVTVSLSNRLRTALTSGAPVTLERPTAPFRLLSHSGVRYVPGFGEEVEMILAEKI